MRLVKQPVRLLSLLGLLVLLSMRLVSRLVFRCWLCHAFEFLHVAMLDVAWLVSNTLGGLMIREATQTTCNLQ
ncbi:hypothetical protein HDV64DRAFT_248805 [Trichoderma sp. TUCIM 5745]